MGKLGIQSHHPYLKKVSTEYVSYCTSIYVFDSEILSKDDLPPTTPLLENICAYPWHIETKYYSADVSLCTSDVRTIGDIKFANSVQAFVAVFDTTQVRYEFRS